MSYLLNIIRTHFRGSFDWLSVVFVFLFTGVFVVLHYKFDCIGTPIRSLPHLVRFPLYAVLYATVLLGSCIILYWRNQIPNVFGLKAFWLMVLLLVGITSFDQSYYLLSIIKETPFENESIKTLIVSLATYLVSFISVVLPAWGMYRYYAPASFYGLAFDRSVRLKHYFAVLIVALALVTISTYSSGISSYYPVFKRSGILQSAPELGIPRWLSIGIFETAYASNFITVELLFRGLFVFTLSKYLGKYAILPMAACYMVFHFGKPLVETLSSFFGGYMLGIFAFYTKNTWGGIVLHIGTALFMEMVASLL
jgi:hypothetical protein